MVEAMLGARLGGRFAWFPGAWMEKIDVGAWRRSVGIGGRGPEGGAWGVEKWVVGFGVSLASAGVVMARFDLEPARERSALLGRGQSSGVSGYSIGLSAMSSIMGRLRKGLGRIASGSEEASSSGSVSLYQVVPWASTITAGLRTRGVWSGRSFAGGVKGEPPAGEVV